MEIFRIVTFDPGEIRQNMNMFVSGHG